MAAKPKLALAEVTLIPLDKLVISEANVRQANADAGIEALADDIDRRGLLQSLSVRPVLDAGGSETGTYEIPAGGRRWRALKLLVKRKRLARNAPIPCIIKTTGIAEEDSLAENTKREALHPLDEFRAFAALRAKGQTEEDIAAAFGVTPAVVRQRLRLASASPRLLDAYAGDELNLEQLMAFCVTRDHARQDQVLEAIQRREFSPDGWNIRRLLTETCVEADDPRARFVGIAAYEVAGGTIMRDLFAEDDGGWLQDPDLLMRLAAEKLAAERERILSQGWKWVEAAIDLPYDRRFGLQRLQATGPALSEEEQARCTALGEQYDALVEGLSEDDIPEDVRAQLDAIDAEMADLDSRPPEFAPEDIARGGVLVSLNRDGRLQVEYGFIRPEDAPAPASPRGSNADDADSAVAGPGASDAAEHSLAAEPQDDEIETGKPLSDRLVQDLTAYRTAALRNALAQDFDIALLAVLHAMCLDLFYPLAPHSCLQLKANDHFPASAPGLGELVAARAIDKRHQLWATELPADPRTLWDALVEITRKGRHLPLFAHCASLTVNAVREPHQPRRDALRHGDILAAVLSLDMALAGWTTTADNYLGRVTKAHILDAVREAKGEDTVRLIEHLKKTDMAREAERLIAGTGWLPEALRTPERGHASPLPAGLAPQPSALPEFLAEGMDEDSEGERLAAE